VDLIPGVERTIHGKHVLLLNFPACADEVTSFEELADLKARCHGLVIAPHPFYQAPTCLGRHMDAQAAIFDAVEYNGFYTRHLNAFNRMAARWARRHGKPLVAATDVHRLDQIGPTYTLVDAEAEASAICSAIRAGRVEIRTAPMSARSAVIYIARLVASEVKSRLQRRRRSLSPALACPPLARETE
jgi:predicted metal-dependent phosphoesterase TrpH